MFLYQKCAFMRNTADTFIFNGNCVAATLSQTNYCQPLGDTLEQQEHLLSICSSFVVSKKAHLHVSLFEYSCQNKFKYRSVWKVRVLQLLSPCIRPSLLQWMSICFLLVINDYLFVFVVLSYSNSVLIVIIFVTINEAPGRVVVEGEPSWTKACTKFSLNGCTFNLLLIPITKPTCFRRTGYQLPKTIKKQNLNTFMLSCTFT